MAYLIQTFGQGDKVMAYLIQTFGQDKVMAYLIQTCGQGDKVMPYLIQTFGQGDKVMAYLIQTFGQGEQKYINYINLINTFIIAPYSLFTKYFCNPAYHRSKAVTNTFVLIILALS